MVFPLIPVAVAALGGLGIGSLITSLGSGGDVQTESSEMTDIQKTYAPSESVLNYADTSYQYIISSPNAVQTTKKEGSATSTSEATPTILQIPSSSQDQSTGTKISDFMPLIIIAGGAYMVGKIIDESDFL